METKIIPFDLETAKKIQAGEAAGTIKTKNGLSCKIVSYCDGLDFFVERKTEASHFRWCYPYTRDGRYIDGHYNGGTDYDLILEVPDIHKFKVGDKVRVRPNDTHSHFVKQYDNCIGKIVGEHHEYFIVIVTGAFQDQFLAEELQLIEETTGQDVTFQDGNKPQGKRILAECKWGDDGEIYYDVLHWHPTSGLKYPEGWYDAGGENVPDNVIKRFAEF